jgi:formyl-CoA transferase
MDGLPALFTAYGGSAPLRAGAHHATIVPYGPFEAGDGETVHQRAEQREFTAFCDRVLMKVIESDPRFAIGPVRFRNRKMHEEINAAFRN